MKPLAALIAASLLAGPARAAHVVEFQLDVAKLFTLVDDRIAEEELCYAAPIQIPGVGLSVVLDHIEFPGPTQLQKNGQQLQVVVPVAVYTKAAACLTDPNCGPTDYTPPFPYTINRVLDLTAAFSSMGLKHEDKLSKNQLSLADQHWQAKWSGSTRPEVNGPSSLDPGVTATRRCSAR